MSMSRALHRGEVALEATAKGAPRAETRVPPNADFFRQPLAFAALFALFGTQYGGNGQTTFALPDLRGRTPTQNLYLENIASHDITFGICPAGTRWTPSRRAWDTPSARSLFFQPTTPNLQQ